LIDAKIHTFPEVAKFFSGKGGGGEACGGTRGVGEEKEVS